MAKVRGLRWPCYCDTAIPYELTEIRLQPGDLANDGPVEASARSAGAASSQSEARRDLAAALRVLGIGGRRPQALATSLDTVLRRGARPARQREGPHRRHRHGQERPYRPARSRPPWPRPGSPAMYRASRRGEPWRSRHDRRRRCGAGALQFRRHAGAGRHHRLYPPLPHSAGRDHRRQATARSPRPPTRR